MSNDGLIPIDFSSTVGQLRSIIGDVEFTPIDADTGEFTNFSDQQLESYLAIAGGTNIAYAAGYAYLGLAAQFAAEAIKVVTDDESIDLVARADQMRRLAAVWFDRGDNSNGAAGNDYFDIQYPSFHDDDCLPELTQWPWVY